MTISNDDDLNRRSLTSSSGGGAPLLNSSSFTSTSTRTPQHRRSSRSRYYLVGSGVTLSPRSKRRSWGLSFLPPCTGCRRCQCSSCWTAAGTTAPRVLLRRPTGCPYYYGLVFVVAFLLLAPILLLQLPGSGDTASMKAHAFVPLPTQTRNCQRRRSPAITARRLVDAVTATPPPTTRNGHHHLLRPGSSMRRIGATTALSMAMEDRNMMSVDNDSTASASASAEFSRDDVRRRSYVRALRCQKLAGFVGVDGEDDAVTIDLLSSADVPMNGDEQMKMCRNVVDELPTTASRDTNLVVVTGETGAGKSLLTRKALELLCGGKVAPGLVMMERRRRGLNDDDDDQDGDTDLHRTVVQMEMVLFEPHLSSTRRAFQQFGLDPKLLAQLNASDDDVSPPNMGVLNVERVLTIVDGAGGSRRSTKGPSNASSSSRRLKSTCTVNGQVVTLKTLETIVGLLVAIVDAASASTALSKPEARLAMLDAAFFTASSSSFVPSAMTSTPMVSARGVRDRVISAQIAYRKCRREREKLQDELEQRVLPARFTTSTMEPGVDGGGGGGGGRRTEQDTELLKHWVDELDMFEARVLKFRSELLASSSALLILDDAANDNDDLQTTGSWDDTPSLAQVARDVAAMGWTDSAEPTSTSSRRRGFGRSRAPAASASAVTAGRSSSTFTSALLIGLTRYRDVLSALEKQLADSRAALDAMGALSSKQSALTAVERARDLLLGVTQSGKLGEAAERAHELLHVVEESIQDFCRCMDGDDEGLLRRLELELARSAVSKEDVDLILSEWSSLARKHGISPTVLPSCHTSLRAELNGNVHAMSLLPTSIANERKALQEFEDACAQLSEGRQSVAQVLSKVVTARLPSLGMEHAVFEVRVNDQARKCTDAAVYNAPAGSATGLDVVDFLLCMDRNGNPADARGTQGEVHVVASSGEKARLLLSIECTIPGSVGAACRVVGPSSTSVLTSSNDQPSVPPVVVLYDEIDAHVGGNAAVALARMLVDQAHTCQVVAITHNPSVAASGDVHIVVQRASSRSSGSWDDTSIIGSGINAVVRVDAVSGLERRNELARMASGDLAPAEAAIFAEALIRDGSKRRPANATVIIT